MQTSKLNLDLLSNLLKDNKSAIRQALEIFVESTIEDMQILDEKIKDKKFLEASRLTHSLKSRFVYLGNDDASQKVKLLESMLKDARANTYDEIRNLFDKLNLLIGNCITLVNDEIKAIEC